MLALTNGAQNNTVVGISTIVIARIVKGSRLATMRFWMYQTVS